MTITRRQFLSRSSATALGFLGLQQFFDGALQAADAGLDKRAGFGPLIADPNGMLNLPAKFSYQIVSRMGDKMADGLLLPGAPDGMAAFAGDNGDTIVIRNHELDVVGPQYGAFGADLALLDLVPAAKMYDRGKGTKPGLGGTSTFVYDTKAKKLKQQSLSLAGTHRNCAGGPSLWRSWITCEETLAVPDGVIEKSHGFCFEVPVSATPQLADPVPLKTMGRFNHEAVAMDPASKVVYLTEDRQDGLFYRFIPKQHGRLHAGGRLQALALRDKKSANTTNWKEQSIAVGAKLPVAWIDLADIEAPLDDLRLRGATDGAAIFARGEGLWFGNDLVHISCTAGGSGQKGQIWRYRPSPKEGTADEGKAPGELELFIEPNDADVMEMNDNITVAPWGDLLICEDGHEPPNNGLVGVTPNGACYRFALNVLNKSELTGATFSPDGSTLFVNFQDPGITFAITGPWLG